jgi:polar amino acid transport system permease protein
MIASLVSDWPEYFTDLLPGLWMSIRLTAASLAVGMPLGLVFALLVSSSNRPLRWTTVVLVELGRGAPALILLYLVYFGMPDVGLTLSGFLATTVALGYATGAYTSEIFRAGLLAVPSGQHEAATALGLPHNKHLRYVVLPQALRIVVPPLIGFGIIVFQGTSLAFAISVPELLSRAYNIATVTFQYMSVLVLAGLMYAAVSLVMSIFMGSRGRRSNLHL